MIIGIDFDNTIVSYDELIYQIAIEKNLIQTDHKKIKKDIRDTIRKLPNGEIQWQEIQAIIYGPRMNDASLIPGVEEFLDECKKRKIKTVIISHKTEYSNLNRETNFHRAASDWLKQNLPNTNYYFEPTREEKIERIKKEQCTHFIDDLEEVFIEPSFPNIKKIMFKPGAKTHNLTFSDWHELRMIIDIPNITTVTRIYGGKNSRVYKVKADKTYCVKLYADDKRCKKEYNALTFLAKHTTKVPKIIAAQNRLTVLEFIEGSSIQKVVDTDVNEAVNFLMELHTTKSQASNEPASEACFSVSAIIKNIEQRLNRLSSIKELQTFLAELKTALKNVSWWCQEECKKNNIPFEKDISEEEKTLSPSDFGFHNAIKKQDRITFLDFEHFGIDDPAKMICDFLLHPAMNLSNEQKKQFTKLIVKRLNIKNIEARIKIVYPLFALKWCTILLNEFLPNELSRRLHATENLNKDAIQKQQLAKAQQLLRQINDEYNKFPY
ncbi:MAG TPA: phosphotransferase [Candidatus Nanoarchaeia archaeon]|nr:phosphotransferase [Candidatus Nanoarchaeia archaeon]